MSLKSMIESKKENPIIRSIGNYGAFQRRAAIDYGKNSKEAYLTNFVVYRCIEELTEAMSMVDVVVKDRNKTNDDIIKNHPFVEMFNNPNEMYGSKEFIHRANIFFMMTGEAPMHLMKNSFDSKLYVYRPDRISKRITGDEAIPYDNVTYEYARRVRIPDEEFMLWKNYNPLDQFDGFGRGLARISPAAQLIDQLNAFKEWNISHLENGAMFSGILEMPDQTGEIEWERTKSEIRQYVGRKNVGKVLMTDGGKYTQTSSNSRDLDWLEGEKSVIVQTCSALNVDPIIIGFNEMSSYNNKKEALRQFYSNRAIPLLKELLDVIERKAKFFNIVKKGQYVDVDTSKTIALQEDSDALHKRANEGDMLSIDEKRQMVGKPPIGGTVGSMMKGDGYLVIDGEIHIPLNMVPVDREIEPVVKPVVNGKKSYEDHFPY